MFFKNLRKIASVLERVKDKIKRNLDSQGSFKKLVVSRYFMQQHYIFICIMKPEGDIHVDFHTRKGCYGQRVTELIKSLILRS